MRLSVFRHFEPKEENKPFLAPTHGSVQRPNPPEIQNLKKLTSVEKLRITPKASTFLFSPCLWIFRTQVIAAKLVKRRPITFMRMEVMAMREWLLWWLWSWSSQSLDLLKLCLRVEKSILFHVLSSSPEDSTCHLSVGDGTLALRNWCQKKWPCMISSDVSREIWFIQLVWWWSRR